jgi:hypothetical protein
MRRPRLRSLAGGAAGIAAGVIGGVVLTSGQAAVPAAPARGPALIDATHVPPALTLPGEPVQLRYGLVCTPRDDGLPCDGSGAVYVRVGHAAPFRPYALRRDDDSRDGRYFFDVPAELAEGFSYYAVLRDDATGASVTVPSGGAEAPHLSVPLREPVAIALGRHAFGAERTPDARVVVAGWGDVGLAGSRELGYTGPSAFDVEPDGTVDLLDSVNRRVVRFAHGGHETVPLEGDLRLADFAAEPDGSFDVLDAHGALTRFHRDGTTAWTQKLADRTWAKLAHGGVVLQEPSEQWMPVADKGTPLTRPEQARRGHLDAQGLIVDRVGEGEIRIADARGLRSWRITSETPLGEVQLAERHGNGIVVVTHAYTDDRDEFVVLVLGGRGVVQRFSVSSDTWTETAPLGRFRVAGDALYRLRTTPAGATVDRFDLEVPQ